MPQVVIDGNVYDSFVFRSDPTAVGDEATPMGVSCHSSSPAVLFTRPADTTAYVAADVVGSASTANHEATSAGISGNLMQILSASLIVNLTSVPTGMTTFRLHIWDSAPTAIADNAAFSVATADRAKYCGFIDLAAIQAIGGGFCWTQGDYIGRPLRLSSTSFWFNLVTNEGFTPASETEYQVRFHAVEVGR